MTKPGLPIRQLGNLAEEALGAAKAPRGQGDAAPRKNAVTCFGRSVGWTQFHELLELSAKLADCAEEYALSTGYLYALLRFVDMAADTSRPENALWHSQFAYRTRRLAETRIRNLGDREETEQRRRRLQSRLGNEIAGIGIGKHGADYRIALFTYLYQQRV